MLTEVLIESRRRGGAPRRGQRPVAYVTFADGASDLGKLKAAIAPIVQYDLTVMTVRSLASFPMTPTGKIAKAQLRQSAMPEGG